MDKDNTKVEINLGPTVELNMRGKSNWAKANITVGAEKKKKLNSASASNGDVNGLEQICQAVYMDNMNILFHFLHPYIAQQLSFCMHCPHVVTVEYSNYFIFFDITIH